MTVSDSVVSAVEPEHIAEALQLIFAQLEADQRKSQADQTIREINAGKLSCAGIFVASRANRIVGATWCQLQPGRTAAVWPARLEIDEPELTCARLYEAVDNYLRKNRTRLAQGLVTTDSGQDARWLASCGYHHIADLLYMVSDRSNFPVSDPTNQLCYRTFSEANSGQLATLIEDTYQDTLDCPALNGVRDRDDVLESYRSTGIYDANRWFFLERNPHQVGCLLLTDHPDQQQWEIIYAGLVPGWRGRGWGLEATRYAQWLTHQAGRERLVLAVDADNQPAIRAYALAGFAAWDRRSIMMKILPDAELFN